MRLAGKTALVTGAGQGIGRTIVLTLAREGANITVCDLNLETAATVADEVKYLGREAVAIKVDVSKPAEVAKMAAEAVSVFKRIDILVNDAGVITTMPILDMTEAIWDSMMDVNLKGQFLCCQAVGRYMVKQGSGKIVNIASIVARVGSPGQVCYSASKSGVLQLTRGLAVEWARYNINVNSVSPGATVTAMTEKAFQEHPDILSSYVSRIPMGRMAQPQDIANAVLFFASSEADDITGQDIAVDGGTLALHPGHTLPKS